MQCQNDMDIIGSNAFNAIGCRCGTFQYLPPERINWVEIWLVIDVKVVSLGYHWLISEVDCPGAIGAFDLSRFHRSKPAVPSTTTQLE